MSLSLVDDGDAGEVVGIERNLAFGYAKDEVMHGAAYAHDLGVHADGLVGFLSDLKSEVLGIVIVIDVFLSLALKFPLDGILALDGNVVGIGNIIEHTCVRSGSIGPFTDIEIRQHHLGAAFDIGPLERVVNKGNGVYL